MPDYVLKVKFESIYGPFSYATPAQLKADFLSGALKLNKDNAVVEDDLRTVTVKEVKPDK